LGEWSWGWPGWTPERRSEVGQGGSRDETWKRPGTFWIPFERFVQYFDSVDIAQVNNGGGNGSWTVRYPIPVGFTNDDLPARLSNGKKMN
jgi:hypothetical protein